MERRSLAGSLGSRKKRKAWLAVDDAIAISRNFEAVLLIMRLKEE